MVITGLITIESLQKKKNIFLIRENRTITDVGSCLYTLFKPYTSKLPRNTYVVILNHLLCQVDSLFMAIQLTVPC